MGTERDLILQKVKEKVASKTVKSFEDDRDGWNEKKRQSAKTLH